MFDFDEFVLGFAVLVCGNLFCVMLSDWNRLKDGYLLENCLAVLINLAPQAEHLQPYAAQRLVSVLVAASRRWTEGASAAAAAAEAGRSARNGAQNGDRNSSGGAGLDMGAGVDHGEEDFVGGLSDVQVNNWSVQGTWLTVCDHAFGEVLCFDLI